MSTRKRTAASARSGSRRRAAEAPTEELRPAAPDEPDGDPRYEAEPAPIDTAPAPTASTVKSAAGLSIDALLLGQAAAAPRVPAGAVLSSETPGELARAHTVDEYIERTMQLTSVDRLPDDVVNEPFVLSGLSQEVPNPEWSRLRDEHAALEARLHELVRARESLQQVRRRTAPEDAALRDALMQREAARFEPPDAIKLVKPARAVGFINDKWRTDFNNVITETQREYQLRTTESLAAPAIGKLRAENAALRAQGNLPLANMDEREAAERAKQANQTRAYLQLVVNPVLNELLGEVRAATYEDLPLTREIVGAHLGEFLNLLLNSLLSAESTAQLEQILEAQEREAALPAPLALQYEAAADAVLRATLERIQHVDADEDIETRTRAEYIDYLRQETHVYADDYFLNVFESWRAEAAPRVPPNRADALFASLQRVVENLIVSRSSVRAQANQAMAVPSTSPWALAPVSYTVPHDADLVNLYREYVTKKISLRRNRMLLEQARDQSLERAFAQALHPTTSKPTDVIRSTLLAVPRIDRFSMLERLYVKERARLKARVDATGDPDGQKKLDGLDARYNSALALLQKWSPFVWQTLHSAYDTNEYVDDPAWDMFDLSHPLDVDTVARDEPGLASDIAWLETQLNGAQLSAQARRLRSVLTVGYAEKLAQSELLRVEFALHQLARRTVPVPLDLPVPLLGAPQTLEFAVRLELRPEIELMLRKPPGVALNDRAVQLRDALRNTAFTVDWYFKPSLDAGTRRYRAGQPERLVASTDVGALDIDGGRQATIRVPTSNDGSHAGLYWATVRAPDDNDAFLARSFTACVRAIACCARDNVQYELGTQRYGDCKWTEQARDPSLRDEIEEWRALVERGTAAHEQLLARRQRTGRQPSDRLYWPPWGDDSEPLLLAALDRIRDNGGTEFGYESTVGRILHRLAEQVRALPFAGASEAANLSDLELATLLGDNTVSNTSVWFAAQTLYIERAANDAFVEPALRHTDGPVPPEPRALDDADQVADARARRAAMAGSDAQQLTCTEQLVIDLPAGAVTPLRFGGRLPASALMRLPIVSVLALLRTPLVWRQLTWRERRYVEHVRARLSAFCSRVAVRLRRELLYSASQRDQTWWSLRTAPAYSGAEALEREIESRLAALSPDAIVLEERDEPNTIHDMLTDSATRAEFDALVHTRLVRTGLLANIRSTHRHPFTGEWLHKQRLVPRAQLAPTDFAIDACPVGAAERSAWTDEHDPDSTQAQPYRIAISAGLGATVLQRGSMPAGKFYDFNGLHNIIEAVAHHYTTLARTEPRDLDAERTTEEHLRNLVLAYNYLAFVAPPAHDFRHITGAEIAERVGAQDQTNFFAQARRTHQTPLLAY